MLIRLIVSAVMVVAMVGCATPRYQTVYRYEPPISVAGQTCIKGCEQAQASCGTACQAEWQACTARVEPLVDTRYAQALDAYAADLRYYQRQLDRYEWDLWMGWGPGHYSGMWHSPWYSSWYSPWPYRSWGYAFSPVPPGPQPSRAGAREALFQERCHDDCGCVANFDRCYLSCGGRKISESRCVANCPDAAPAKP